MTFCIKHATQNPLTAAGKLATGLCALFALFFVLGCTGNDASERAEREQLPAQTSTDYQTENPSGAPDVTELSEGSVTEETALDEPEQAAPTPAVAMLVSSEAELIRAIDEADKTPAAIVLTADIELNSTLVIPEGAYVILASQGEPMHKLTANHDRPAILVHHGATLTLQSIILTRTENSGGIASGNGLHLGGTAIMSGGKISNHPRSGVYMISVYGRIAEFTLNEGTISHNKHGGIRGSGITTINGGLITGNSSISNGGGVTVQGFMTMTGGTISNNHTNRSGGGVYISRASIFTMHDGTITGNTSDSGGGVFSVTGTQHTAGGTFIMYGGWIFGNTAETDDDFNFGGTFHNNVFDPANGGIGTGP